MKQKTPATYAYCPACRADFWTDHLDLVRALRADRDAFRAVLEARRAALREALGPGPWQCGCGTETRSVETPAGREEILCPWSEEHQELVRLDALLGRAE